MTSTAKDETTTTKKSRTEIDRKLRPYEFYALGLGNTEIHPVISLRNLEKKLYFSCVEAEKVHDAAPMVPNQAKTRNLLLEAFARTSKQISREYDIWLCECEQNPDYAYIESALGQRGYTEDIQNRSSGNLECKVTYFDIENRKHERNILVGPESSEESICYYCKSVEKYFPWTDDPDPEIVNKHLFWSQQITMEEIHAKISKISQEGLIPTEKLRSSLLEAEETTRIETRRMLHNVTNEIFYEKNHRITFSALQKIAKHIEKTLERPSRNYPDKKTRKVFESFLIEFVDLRSNNTKIQ